MSRRFLEAGFDKPKFMLPAFGHFLFDFAVQTFVEFFHNEKFVFIIRDDESHREFVEQRCAVLKIDDFQIVVLEAPTRGQAETVALGLRGASVSHDDPIIIFNIDTYRKGFRPPLEECDGYLEVFKGEGDHWSFAEINPDDDTVLRTAEKERISDFCSNGIYGFRSVGYFIDLYDRYEKAYTGQTELFIAPMYNLAIQDGARILAPETKLDDNYLFGTPVEYLLFLTSNVSYIKLQNDMTIEEDLEKSNLFFGDIRSKLLGVLNGKMEHNESVSPILLALADRLFKVSRVEEAECVFDFLEYLSGRGINVLYRRGRTRLAHGMPKRAILSFREVIERHNDHPDVLLYLATAYVRSGQKEKAIDALLNAPDSVMSSETRFFMVELLISMGMSGVAANRDADQLTVYKDAFSIAARLKVLSANGMTAARLRVLRTALLRGVELRSIDILHAISLAKISEEDELADSFSKIYPLGAPEKIISGSTPCLPSIRKKKKVALCLSGQLRSFEKASVSIKSCISDVFDTKIFVSCWGTRGFKTSGFQDLHRMLPAHLAALFPEKHLGQKFANRFPKSVSVLDEIATTPIRADDIHAIYPGAAVDIANEADFESKYFSDSLRKEFHGREHLLSQFKMYYQLYLCNNLRKEYEKKTSETFDVVIRLRPDFEVDDSMIQFPDHFSQDIFVDVLHPNEGIGDQFAISSGANMDVYCSVWEKALLSIGPDGKSYFPRPTGVQSHTFLHDVIWANGIAPRLAARSKKSGILPNLPPFLKFGKSLLEEIRTFSVLDKDEILFAEELERALEKAA